MDELSYKVRIASLWLLAIVAFFAYRTLAMSAGADEVSLLGDSDFASYLSVMMLFAFLSLVLPSRLNRLTNEIAGTLFLVAQLIMLTDGVIGYPSEVFNAMTGATVIATASITWLAIRWSRATRVVSTPAHDTHMDGARGPASVSHAA
jgi:hypothetical protein